MTLVKFIVRGHNRPVFINPEHVSAVTESDGLTSAPISTCIRTINERWYVVESVPFVVSQLRKAK